MENRAEDGLNELERAVAEFSLRFFNSSRSFDPDQPEEMKRFRKLQAEAIESGEPFVTSCLGGRTIILQRGLKQQQEADSSES